MNDNKMKKTRIEKVFITLVLSLLTVIAASQIRPLEFYLNEGLRNSPLIKDLQNQLRSVSFDSLLIKASKKPLIEAKSQLLYSPYYRNFGYDEVITDGGNYQAVAAVTQNILNKKETINKYQAAGILKESISNKVKLSSAELKKVITDQYLVSYSDYSEMIFNRSLLDLMHQENDVVKQFVLSGIFRQTDHLSLVIETQGQEVLVIQLKNQYKKDLSLLNQICGLNDTVTCVLLLPHFMEPLIVANTGSPFFKQFTIDSLKIVNDKNALNIKYKPKISWFADAGILTSTPQNFYRHFGYSIGASLSVPIYDGHQKSFENRKLDIQEDTRMGYKGNYKKQHDQILQQLKGELEGTKNVKMQLENQLTNSNQLIESLKEQLNTGQISMTDYINAIKNYRSINWNLNIINIRMLQIINEMNYILSK
jgi:hypothetical protein